MYANTSAVALVPSCGSRSGLQDMSLQDSLDHGVELFLMRREYGFQLGTRTESISSDSLRRDRETMFQ